MGLGNGEKVASSSVIKYVTYTLLIIKILYTTLKKIGQVLFLRGFLYIGNQKMSFLTINNDNINIQIMERTLGVAL